jgi:iron complex transport system substrate-binding protein
MLKPLLLACSLLLLSLPLQAAVTVQDDAGRTVTLEQPARRIISLAPHVTEQLFAIGAGERIVGAVDYSDYPQQAKAIPRVGGYSRLDLERILALQPDLVVGWQSGNDARQLERLQQLGLAVYLSEPRHLDDIASNMERLGRLSGAEKQARAAAARFRQGIAALRAQHQNVARLRVFYQIWNRPLMTVNGEHLINDVITLCGGGNIFAAIDTLTPTVSEEAVLAANPQVIIASGMAAERPEWLDDWRRWPQLAAVKNKQLYVIPPDIIQRATPRLLQGAERICQLLDTARQPRH